MGVSMSTCEAKGEYKLYTQCHGHTCTYISKTEILALRIEQ